MNKISKKRALFLTLIVVATLMLALSGVAFAENATFDVPTAPMTVDENVITVAAHSMAYVTPEIIGINNVTSRNNELPYTYKTIADASVTPILGIFGSNINEAPNPYLYNYFYNCYANEKGLPLAAQHTLSQGIGGSPAAADLTVLPEYGTSVSLYLRPDILLGDSDSKAYTAMIAALPENTDTDTTNDYNPYQVSYPMVSTYNFLDSLYELAEACNQITMDTGKVCRYGDPLEITTDLEKYVKGLECYVLSRLDAANAEKKVVAVVDPINSKDGIFYGMKADSSTASTTSRCRAGEFVADTTTNIVDILGKTSESGTVGGTADKTYYILTAEEIAQADIIITSGVQVTDGDEAAFRELLLTYVDSANTALVNKIETMPILSTRPSCVGSMGVNAAENLLGMVYWTAYCYPEYLNPIYSATYFYENFYHVTDASSLQTAIAANFAKASIPAGYGFTTDITGYNPADIESKIIAGMNYYTANSSKLTDTMLYTQGNTGSNGWDIDWTLGIGSTAGETPAPVKTVVSNQKLVVNGQNVNCSVYNVDGYNYFMLRDVAYMLKGTADKFSVTYYPSTRIIAALSGADYVAAGTEMKTGKDKSSSCVVSTQDAIFNGSYSTAYAYNIGGSNYFQLRALGDVFGFSVSYDETTRTITVATD